MTDKDKKFSEAFLFDGKDLRLADGIYVKHPTVGEISKFSDSDTSFDDYSSAISLLTCDPYDYMVMLDDMGIDYEKVDNFDIFCYLYNQYLDKYKKNQKMFDSIHYCPIDFINKALSFFLGRHNFKLSSMLFNVNGEIIRDRILLDYDLIHKDDKNGDSCDYVIDRYMFNKMSEFISEINGFDKSQRIDPENDSYKKMLIEDMRDEIKKKSKKKKNENEYGKYMGSIMKAVCFCGNGGVTVFNIDQVHIYTLITGFNIFIKKDNVDHLMNGQYDLSKINKKELDWFG